VHLLVRSSEQEGSWLDLTQTFMTITAETMWLVSRTVAAQKGN
jgi:hypothetical protein